MLPMRRTTTRRKMPVQTSTTYDKDFLTWTEEQAALLRAGNFAEADIGHIIEEIEEMGREQKIKLQSLLRQILVHLLKLDLSPSPNPRLEWLEEVSEFRAQAESRIEEIPSLKAVTNDLFQRAWPQVRKIAGKSFEAHGESHSIPNDCPHSLQQVLDPDFLPD